MLSAISSWLQYLLQTMLVKIGLRFDDYSVTNKKVEGNQRVQITVRNERTGKEVTNTAGTFTREQVDEFRELKA
jgi:translation initiation factor 1 (eIF-1/SUI1)